MVITAVTIADLRTGIELASEQRRGARAELLVNVLETLPIDPSDLATAGSTGAPSCLCPQSRNKARCP